MKAYEIEIEKTDNGYYARCSISYQSGTYGGNVLVEIDLDSEDKDDATSNLEYLIDEVIEQLTDAKGEL